MHNCIVLRTRLNFKGSAQLNLGSRRSWSTRVNAGASVERVRRDMIAST